MTHQCATCRIKFTPKCIPCHEKRGGVTCPRCGQPAQPLPPEETV